MAVQLNPRSARVVAGQAVAILLTATGVALALAAEVEPWAARTDQPLPSVAPRTDTLDLPQVFAADSTAYHLVLCGLLGLLGLAVFGRPARRRATAAGVVGVALGQAVVLTSVGHAIHVHQSSGFFDAAQAAAAATVRYEFATGFYLAAVALGAMALAAAAAMVVGGTPESSADRAAPAAPDALVGLQPVEIEGRG